MFEMTVYPAGMMKSNVELLAEYTLKAEMIRELIQGAERGAVFGWKMAPMRGYFDGNFRLFVTEGQMADLMQEYLPAFIDVMKELMQGKRSLEMERVMVGIKRGLPGGNDAGPDCDIRWGECILDGVLKRDKTERCLIKLRTAESGLKAGELEVAAWAGKICIWYGRGMLGERAEMR